MEGAPICRCNVIHEGTVQTVHSQMLKQTEYLQLAALFKLFGDPTRLKILHALELHELCVCDIAALLGLTKSAVSHQLKSLRTAQLVKFRRDGQIVYYSLNDEHASKIINLGQEHMADFKRE